MSTHQNICQNPNCKSSYSVDPNEVDDGYCCYACWEDTNCGDPEVPSDVLDTEIEELAYKSN